MTDYKAISNAVDHAKDRLYRAASDWSKDHGQADVLDRELRGAAVGIAIELLRGAAAMDPDREDAHRMSLAILEVYYVGATRRESYP